MRMLCVYIYTCVCLHICIYIYIIIYIIIYIYMLTPHQDLPFFLYFIECFIAMSTIYNHLPSATHKRKLQKVGLLDLWFFIVGYVWFLGLPPKPRPQGWTLHRRPCVGRPSNRPPCRTRAPFAMDGISLPKILIDVILTYV